jgi:hypothetical protein
MDDKYKPKVPEGLKATGWIVAGLLAFDSYSDLGHWLAFQVWRGHEMAVKIAAVSLCLVAAAAAWAYFLTTVPSRTFTRPRLLWIACVAAFFGLMLLIPFQREFRPD